MGVVGEMSEKNLHITMLGTGHATVTKCYNTCFVLHEKDNFLLVDAGGGNQILRILEEQNISLTSIHDLFLTHAHSDHLLGAVWIIRMIGQLMNKQEYSGDLRIYAHEQVIQGLQTICKTVLMEKITNFFGDRMKFVALQDGDAYQILGREITFFDIKSTKLLQYGFQIKQEGILFCGDEPLKEELYENASGVKYLLHEAFCLASECEKFKPYEKHHSTVKDACCLAEQLKVENLVLMHTEDSHIDKRKQLYTEEGKAFFSGNLLIPDDGECIEIRREK